MGYGTGAIMAVPATTSATSSSPRRSTCRSSASSPPTPASRPTRRSTPGRGRAGRRGQLAERRDHARRPADRRGQGRDHRLAARNAGSAGRRSTTSSATGSSAASATGASRSRSCSTRTTASTPSPSRELPVLPARAGGLQADRQARAAARQGDGLGPLFRQGYRRETNTMPQWAGSCWYYLRYLDPKNDERPGTPRRRSYWMPVDLYVGGAEHAVLHLLYSRFWHKVLFDRGHGQHARAVPEAGQPGDDPGRDRVHRASRTSRAGGSPAPWSSPMTTMVTGGH